MKKVILLLALLLINHAADAELLSTRHENTIKSNGIGEINLMRSSTGDKVITAAELEAFRQDNNGVLVFSVDVNEASSGSENAESQGVAILEAWVDVRINGVVYRFSDFSTKTRSSVATWGSTNRQFYYTVIGDAGSSRFTSNTSSDIYGSSFDGTLSLPVNIDISQASAAWLHVRLLQTNTQLGDPEAYYDFSGGFEDLAILTHADAVYLDALQPGRSLAPLAVSTDSAANTITSYVYYPSATEYYMVAYEDQFPKKGDYDFNDLVVGYRIYYGLEADGKIKTIEGEGYLAAKGGSYDHDWYLHIPLPANTTGQGELKIYSGLSTTPMDGYPQSFEVTDKINLKVFDNVSTLFYDTNSQFTNTIWNSNFVPGNKFRFTVTLDNSIPANSVGTAPFDPYLYVRTTGYEIHLPGESPLLPNSLNVANNKTNFKDSSGYPFAMILPQNWVWPNEYVDLGLAYPQFIDFVTSSNQTHKNWYELDVPTGVYKKGNKWKW